MFAMISNQKIKVGSSNPRDSKFLRRKDVSAQFPQRIERSDHQTLKKIWESSKSGVHVIKTL